MTQEINKSINEDLTTPAAPEIATSDENLSVNSMFQQTSIPSLGRQVFSVLPIHGPTAALFNIRNKAGGLTTDFELVRAEVIVENSTAIHTGISSEAVQDIQSQYGKKSSSVIGKLLRGVSNDAENVDTLTFLTAESVADGTLILTDAQNAETNLFEISQKIQSLVLRANTVTRRTYEAFAVVPYAALGGIMALKQYAGADDKNERGLFITQIGLTKYYMHPDPAATTVFVGLKDSYDESKSSGVFSPYTSDVIDAVDPDTGDETYHLYNRYAITASPLHDAVNNPMFFKFTLA